MYALPHQCRPLAHPISLLAIVAWLLNDHWAKAAFHNAATGKISDVAGLIVLPLLLIAILTTGGMQRRRAAQLAVALTAGFFLALNTSSWFSDGIEAMLGLATAANQLTADPTDLIALPALLVPWWLATRAAQPATPHRVRVARAAFLVGAAACVATGGPGNADGRQEGLIGTPDGFEFFDDDALWVSADGNQWTAIDAEAQEPDRVGARVSNWPAAPVAVRHQHVCAGIDDQRQCFDIVDDGSAITSSIGGSEPVVEFVMPADRNRFRNIPACRWLPKVECSNRIAINSIAIATIDDQAIVIAEVNRSGGLRRTEAGSWEPFTLGTSEPNPLTTNLPQIEHLALLIAAVAAGALVGSFARVPPAVEQQLPINPTFSQDRNLHARLLGWATAGLILLLGWWPIRNWAGSLDTIRADAVQSTAVRALVLFVVGTAVAIYLRRRPITTASAAEQATVS